MTTRIEDDLRHRLRHLEVRDGDLVARPTDEDLYSLEAEGMLGRAAGILREKTEAGGGDAGLARRALERLFVESHEVKHKMGMILRRILLENFRKFRKPHEVSGLGDGLNILIAPNETGKSTVMEAVRAALFLRHGSKTQLIQSLLPYGDSVGPEVQLDFEIDGAPYSLTKRFMSKATAELEGPDGRQQGDAAEEALQELLGFEKQSARSIPARSARLVCSGFHRVMATLSLPPAIGCARALAGRWKIRRGHCWAPSPSSGCERRSKLSMTASGHQQARARAN